MIKTSQSAREKSVSYFYLKKVMLMPWNVAFCLGFVGVVFVKSLFFSLFCLIFCRERHHIQGLDVKRHKHKRPINGMDKIRFVYKLETFDLKATEVEE